MLDAINVTALNKYVKSLLESDAVLTDIAIKGEVSNFVNHFKTGHFYFSLKDQMCSVKAVMFRTDAQRISFKPENGMNVIIFCRVSLFERDGSFQIYVTEMIPDGIGAMQLAFEQLKQRLSDEGLFDEAHKKPLPLIPQKIAIVTSKTGAALQDILNVTSRRYPAAHLILVPVTVQGSEAACGIANGIILADGINADVIIVARGGGSKEDLWVFNDERIARAAFNAKTPLVSAIGHEIDFSILDFVADLRAPTPSAAAELVMPDFFALYAKNTEIYTNIRRQIQNRMKLCYNNMKRYTQADIIKNTKMLPMILKQEQARNSMAIQSLVHNKLRIENEKIAHNAALAQSLSPYKVLARGYGLVLNENGTINSVKKTKKGSAVEVVLADGRLFCKVEDIMEEKHANL